MSTLKVARDLFRAYSKRFGGGANPFLLSETHKSELARKGYTQRVVHLLPASESIRVARALDVSTDGWKNLCVCSTRGCRAVCLTHSGRLGLTAAQTAAFARSVLWQQHRPEFQLLLDDEIRRFKASCDDQPVVRVYGTHDGSIFKDLPGLAEAHPDVIFNDYTKVTQPTGWVAPNVYRCKSATEYTTPAMFAMFRMNGLNHAVPFNLGRNDPLPETYLGIPVVDGDHDDLRFLDPDGVIVGLRYKVAHGVSVSESNGFIRDIREVPVYLKK